MIKLPAFASDTTRSVWLILCLNALLWTFLPWLSTYSLPLDVVEGLFWGKEWQWGYYKHPPLPAWLVNLSWLGLGDLGPFFLSQLSLLVTFWYVWRLGLKLLGTEQAALGTLLLLGVYYFTWPSPEYNHNIAQMPIWAAAAFYYYQALHSGRYRDWILLGFCAGLGFLTKYVMVVLLTAMFLHLLTQTQGRRQLLRWPLWSGVLVMLLVFLPHLIWLIQHDFLPLQYAQQRSGEAATPLQAHLLGPVKFLVVQLLDHLPLLILLAATGFLARAVWSKDQADSSSRWFLIAIGLGPALLTAIVAGATGTGLRDMWGTPMWNLSGLLIVSWWITPLSPKSQNRLLRGSIMMVLLLVTLRLVDMSLLPYLKDKPSRTGWPDKALATELERVWQEETNCSLDIVAAEYWLGGLVSLRASTRPSVLIDGRMDYSPWIDAERLQASGVLMLWQGDEMPNQLRQLGEVSAEGFLQLDWPVSRAAPLQIGWAIKPPSSCYDSSDNIN
jgi:4-amino-4-deoxy-L-arabinose transferase-like glycosyltransferase